MQMRNGEGLGACTVMPRLKGEGLAMHSQPPQEHGLWVCAELGC